MALTNRWADREPQFFIGTPGFRLTARGHEKRSYHPSNERQTRNEAQIMEAAAVLLQAFRDYHMAKKLIKKQKVTAENFKSLPCERRNTIYAGKSAWEWFKNPPVGNKPGYTFQGCCELLGFDPKRFTEKCLRPSAWRTYCGSLNFMANDRLEGPRKAA
jgi:hypothetical protein